MKFDLRLVPLILLMLFSLAIASGLIGGHPAEQNEQRLVGTELASFTLPGLNSADQFSPALWKGRVAILNVFASWCPSCQKEHPVLMKIAQSGKVPVYGLVWRDKPEKVAAWLGEHGNPYQMVGVDEAGRTTIALALTGVPETLIIDRQGRIYYRFGRPITDDIAEQVILPLVEKLNNGDVK